MERIETTILRNLVFSEEYSRKVIPFIQPDYFEDRSEKVIFQEITHFIVKYNSSITIGLRSLIIAFPLAMSLIDVRFGPDNVPSVSISVLIIPASFKSL